MLVIAVFVVFVLMISANARLLQKVHRPSFRLLSGAAAPLPTYLLEYKYVSEMGEKRGPYREDHLRLAKEYTDASSMIAAGAFTAELSGAVFIFKGDKNKIGELIIHIFPQVR